METDQEQIEETFMRKDEMTDILIERYRHIQARTEKELTSAICEFATEV